MALGGMVALVLVSVAATAGWWVAALVSGLVMIGGGGGRRSDRDAREVGSDRSSPSGGPPAVERVRLAQRAGRHVRGGRGRTVVRPSDPRDARAQRMAAVNGGTGRPWRVVRDLLAARGRPGQPRRRRRRSTAAASCRPTCSTTGCSAWTRSDCGQERHSGPNSVILPAGTLGKHATVGPVSLVMRGESVPNRTRWIGNPIEPWVDSATDDGRPT